MTSQGGQVEARPHIEPSERVPTPELMAAQAELARLVRRAVNPPAGASRAIGDALLARLLGLTAAQRGALLVPAPRRAGRRPPPRAFALKAMTGEEARTIQAALRPAGDGAPLPIGDVLWMTQTLPLTDREAATHARGDGARGDGARGDGAVADERRDDALLVLGWEFDGASLGMPLDVTASARTDLALVADLAGAVIAAAQAPAHAGAPGGGVGAGADRADLRAETVEQAQADWERTFDAISDPVAVLTPDYRIVRANAAYTAFFGLTRGVCEGHECFASDLHKGEPCVGCPLPRTTRTRKPAFTRQVRMAPSGPNGALEPRVYEVWTYPVLGVEGEVERVVEIIKDVTERERLRQATSQAEALREADRLKAELLGTVSHELRSPLTAIKGYAATLIRHERRLPREERHEFLLAIGEASDRLEQIIDRLLEMSQLETGAVGLERQPVDIAGLAREALLAAERRAAERAPGRFSFALRRDLAPTALLGEELPISGDARRLRAVLDNLLENAVKYSPNGGSVTVTLRAPADPQPAPQAADANERPGPMLEIAVQDSGVGIPAEHQGRVFERFHRVDAGLTQEVDGLGLGLAICKRIVELHGGSIWVESRPGEGSTFRALLPLDVGAPGADAGRG